VTPSATRDIARILGELQQLQRELVEQRYVRRSDGLERVGEAVRRLDDVGSPAGIISRSAEALGTSSDFDRVLVSRVQDGHLLPLMLWSRDDQQATEAELAALQARPIPLGYPLIESEVAEQHGGTIVSVAAARGRACRELAAGLSWERYVVAPITLEGNTVGLLHADRSGRDPALDDVDLELATLYVDGLARAFERAVLREHVELQRTQLHSAARWIDGQIGKLTAEATPVSAPPSIRDDADFATVLTSRELEVLSLMARGQSNRAIAKSLMLGEGTVKYHVKNILRKLQARSRAHAVSRYMQRYAASEFE
jgi:DNA-binding CsgD family transcriptional regulator